MSKRDLFFSILGMLIVGASMILRGIYLDNTEPEQEIMEYMRHHDCRGAIGDTCKNDCYGM